MSIATGVGAGVGGMVGRGLAMKFDVAGKPLAHLNTWNTPGAVGHGLAVSMADAVSQAAGRSLVEGSSFGDNLIAALPSVLGNTIGNLVAQGLAESRTPAVLKDQIGPPPPGTCPWTSPSTVSLEEAPIDPAALAAATEPTTDRQRRRATDRRASTCAGSTECSQSPMRPCASAQRANIGWRRR